MLTAAELTKIFQATKGFDRLMNKVNSIFFLLHRQQFEKCILNLIILQVNILKCADGHIKAELTVEEAHTNPIGTLHGGMSATLVDSISSFALYSHKNGAVPSVSVDIHLT